MVAAVSSAGTMDHAMLSRGTAQQPVEITHNGLELVCIYLGKATTHLESVAP